MEVLTKFSKDQTHKAESLPRETLKKHYSSQTDSGFESPSLRYILSLRIDFIWFSWENKNCCGW